MRKTPYWTGVIERAIERKREGKPGFNARHRFRSGNWPDCACGEQDPRIPRDSDKSPNDSALFELGMNFHRAVKANATTKAKRILSKIEKRSAEILSALDAGGQGGGSA